MTQPAGTWSLFATLRQDADRSAHGPREHGGLADVQLVALAREDRAAAMELMYSAHKGRIYTFLLRFLADAEMADDVTQDTFTKAYAALGSLTPSHRCWVGPRTLAVTMWAGVGTTSLRMRMNALGILGVWWPTWVMAS